MKSYKEPYFVLKHVVADSVRKATSDSTVPIQVIDDFVTSIALCGQPDPLQKVLHLLLTNALRSSTNKIMVTTRQLLQTENSVLLEFSIADDLQNILQYKEKKKTDLVSKLPIAEALIAEMGGKSERINVSGAGVGLKFVLKFKLFFELKPVAEQKASAALLTGKRILVVEDNEVNQQTIESLLTAEGAAAEMALDGKAAIDLMERNKGFDLVIMDLQMPHMNGFEAAKYIRRKLSSNIPIIALTACTDDGERLECFSNGMNQYLAKPFAAQELSGLLHHFLLCPCPLWQARGNAANLAIPKEDFQTRLYQNL